MSDSQSSSHLPEDPKKWVRDLEAVWQAKDAKKAAEGFTEDAVQVWGTDQKQSGPELLTRPAQWFSYAKDLMINKEYVAHTGNCIVTTWNSTYTHPETAKKMHERGIECFYFRDGKVCEQRVWQHSWADGSNMAAKSFSTD
ncbi:MAG: nuclear transport factor 2 family protein [Fimbriimonadaceae bacterium]|nr:nuclear transport factor 2 family protein [Alphaproteobacteria bacterium]